MVVNFLFCLLGLFFYPYICATTSESDSTIAVLNKKFFALVEAGLLQEVQESIAQGAQVNSDTENGFTSVYLAARGGHKECLEKLIAAKADINGVNRFGYNPLCVAATFNHEAAVTLLIGQKADVNRICGGVTPLHIAVSSGYKAIVWALIVAQADIHQLFNGQTLIEIATASGHLDIAEQLRAANKLDDPGVVAVVPKESKSKFRLGSRFASAKLA
jgi:ankyrin repeat protein